MMKKYLIIILLILFNLGVVFYVDYEINLPNILYYNGKDGGLIVRFGTTIIMSTIYFFIMSKKNKIIFSVFGLITGVLTFIMSYLLIGKFTKLNHIFFQLIATTFFISIFHIIEKRNKNLS